MKEYDKNLHFEVLTNIPNFYTGSNIDVALESDNMTIHGNNGNDITIENEVFELIMAKYIERKKKLKVLNK